MKLLALAALVLLAVSSAAAAGPSRRTLVVGGYRLYPAPALVAAQCQRAQLHVRFPVLCPTLMPRTCDAVPATRACPELPLGDKGILPRTFAQWADYPRNLVAPWLYVGGGYGGGETDPADWSANNPNYFFHFFVAEGHLTAQQLDLRGVETPQRFLGHRTIAGHRGSLYTQVSYSLCKGDGCSFTGHLTFIWRQHGVVYAASLHRWSADPHNQTVLAILTALTAHLGPV